jgi:Fic family protein
MPKAPIQAKTKASGKTKAAPKPKPAMKVPAKAVGKPSKAVPKPAPSVAKKQVSVRPAPPPPPPKPVSLEERTARLETRLQAADAAFQQQYRENLDMSWIYHDSALEGSVYTVQELRAAIDPAGYQGEIDSSMQPVIEEIRRHREALDFIRDHATNKKKVPITIDTIKQIYLILHPEEGDVKSVRYRKDVPQHRLYFHEYAAPDKIPYKVRDVVDWLNDPESKRTRTPVRLAARAHYDLLRAFPFPEDSGKVARLLLNLLLLRGGLPPAIIHSTERQRYYEALKGSSATMNQIVQESIDNNLASIEKLLDGYEGRGDAAAR